MLERFANTILKQLGLLLVWAILGFATTSLLDFRPRTEFGFHTLGEGIAGSVLLLLVGLSLHALMLLIAPLRHAAAIENNIRMWKKRGPWTTIGFAIVVAAGEEFFIRGCIVGYLANYSNLGKFSYLLAITVGGLLSTLLAFRGRRYLTWTAIQGIEGLLIGTMFLSLHSLTATAIARFLATTLTNLLLCSTEATTRFNAAVKFVDRLRKWL